MLRIAKRREIGVIAGPIDGVADGGDRAQDEQRPADAVHLRQQWVLRAAQNRAGDGQRLEPEATRRDEKQRADRKSARQYQGKHGERRRRRHPGLQQEGEKERAASR